MTQAPPSDPNTQGVRTLMGVHDLYTRLDAAMDAVNIDPPLALNARKLIVHSPYPRGMGELAEALSVTKPTFTALADDLESKGYVQRVRAKEDRRVWLLCLTEHGEATRLELMQRANDFVQTITGLSPKDQTELTRLLDLIREINGNTECPYS